MAMRNTQEFDRLDAEQSKRADDCPWVTASVNDNRLAIASEDDLTRALAYIYKQDTHSVEPD